MSTDVGTREHRRGADLAHDHASHEHGHSHGLVDRSIARSREGVRAVAPRLAIQAVTAVAQLAVFVFSSSVALLADLVHNLGDALTAVPLGIAFWLRNVRLEKLACLVVVAVIFVSACVALYDGQALPAAEDPTHLWALAAAGVIGFVGNERAAKVRVDRRRLCGRSVSSARGHDRGRKDEECGREP